MSGPIVRKYGFPNFDQIFGKKELEHGAEEPATESGAPGEAGRAKTEEKAGSTESPPRERPTEK